MKSPITGGAVKKQLHHETIVFRGESLSVPYINYVCEDSDTEFTTKEADTLNLAMLHHAYRIKHNIPFPDEIVATREQFGLSQRKMSEILGFGINTYRNYENGDVPQLANAKLIRIASKPYGFIELVQQCDVLKPATTEKLLKKARELSQKESDATLHLFKFFRPAYQNGFRSPSFHRISAMINYLTADRGFFKTKLNKLLFYADFHHFNTHGRSLSGLTYQAIQMGPVPHLYDALYAFGNEQDAFSTEVVLLDEGEGTRITARRNIDASELFSSDEIKSLALVKNTLGPLKTTELITMSHEENAWLENQEARSFISYDYALSLKFPAKMSHSGV
jgi:putative zinc finger/helix-turn-helix YgiT family protein